MSSRTAAALGFFDGLHIGHAAVIECALKAAEDNGLTPAAFVINGEPALPKFAGRTDMCLMTFPEKTAALRERFGVTELYSPDFGSIRGLLPEEFFTQGILGRMNAGIVCCGEDFRFGKNGAGDAELLRRLCEEHGILCDIVPPVCVNGTPVSSTYIRGLIRGGDVAAANELLICPFGYELPVTHGKQLGRTIGFPTINQEIPAFMVHPARGVYASEVKLDDRRYPAVTNIGTKPTVKSDNAENMETHIIGYGGDLYGQTVRVTLLRYLRPERKFDSLDELRQQLERDKTCAVNS